MYILVRMLTVLLLFLSKCPDTSFKPIGNRTDQYYPKLLQLNYQSTTRKDKADLNVLTEDLLARVEHNTVA